MGSRRWTLSGLLGLTLAATVVFTSCDRLGKAITSAKESMAGIYDVQQALVKAAPAENVTVNVNNGQYLGINLINSSWKDLPPEEKKAKAYKMAKLAYTTYPGRAGLSRIQVTFVVKKSFLITHYTNTLDGFTFSPADLTKP